MARIVLALEAYHHDLAQRSHPTVGVPTCNVGVIEGGSTANAVPDRCIVRLDRRMIPREDPVAVQAEIQAVVTGVDVGGASVAVTEFLYSSWFDSSVNSSLANVFIACVREALQDDPGPVGYLPGSDAKHLMHSVREGGEIIIFGPGSYEVAHAFDEYVLISDYLATVTILIQFMHKTLLG
jgi:acetylornithine deacetylase/succinyl-diaminopimelate desuccinylase-like protein